MRGLLGSVVWVSGLGQPPHLSVKVSMSLKKKLQQHKPVIWTPRPEVLLDPPIPIPLSGTAPRVVMPSEWWEGVKAKAKASTDYRCIVCKGGKSGVFRLSLECHERYEIDWLFGTSTYLETVPLCAKCHGFIHPGFLRSTVDHGIISRQEMEDILERGRAILRAAGLERPDDKRHRSWASVEWQEWRLIVEGKEYPPLYDSLEAFQTAMKGNK